MAAEEQGEKTEAPTPQRLRKARERGEVSEGQSRDLTGVIVLGLAVVAVTGLGGAWAKAFLGMVERAARGSHADPGVLRGGLVAELGQAFGEGLCAAAPLILGAAAASALLIWLQIGPVFSVDPLKPDLKRLDPIAGLKRTFFSLKSWVTFLKVTLLAAAGVFAVWSVVGERAPQLLGSWRGDLPAAASTAGDAAAAVARRLLLVFGAVAAIDTLFQRFQLRKRLLMSRQEIRREYEEQEGKPENKMARRRLMDEILQNRMFGEILKAKDGGFVAANPVHIACAVGYDEASRTFRLLARGRGLLAERIKEFARANSIPVRYDVPLARALVALEPGEPIPPPILQAMAAVLLWVEDLAAERGESPAWRRRATVEERPVSGGA